MKIIKLFFNIITWLILLVIGIMVLYIVSSNFNVFFGYRSYLVQSGSMEPAIMTGDIVVVHSQKNYMKNDVVTFHNSDNRIVTHRIIEISQTNNKQHFLTKGDANRSEDEDLITQEQIIGKVALVIPKLGYLVSFSKTLPGLIILVIIPAALFILNELLMLKNA